MVLEYKVIDNEYFNIKELLKSHFGMSYKLLIKIKKNGRIFLNKNISYINTRLSQGDIVTIYLDFKEESDNIVSVQMNLNILYEDEYLLILDKPSNTPIHPTSNHYSDSLASGVKYYFESINLKRKIRPVNRLDKDTTGIVIFAKHSYIQECLVRQMKTNEFKKEYIAILDGALNETSGTINAPISRTKDSIIQREVSQNGETSITHFKVVQYLGNFTLVNFILETGRTHQIRVHCKHIGNPILGDTLYGSSSNLINRQALHAHKVTFIHPISKETVIITSKIPSDIDMVIQNN